MVEDRRCKELGRKSCTAHDALNSHALCDSCHGFTHLVFTLEDEHIGNLPKWDAKVDDLRLGHLIGDVANVDHAGRSPGVLGVQLHLQQQRRSVS